MKYSKFLISFILLFLFIACNNETTSPQSGIISVLVIDGNTPVPNQEITLMPDSLVKTTNEQGICKFELEPGNYRVKASLPGPGPALRQYNENVILKSNETVELKLSACMACL